MPTTRHESYTQCPIIAYTYNDDGTVRSVNVTFAPTENDRIAAKILDREFQHIYAEEVPPHHPLNDVINRLKGN